MAVHGNLLVATVLMGADRDQFQSVECAFIGQGFAFVAVAKMILAGWIQVLAAQELMTIICVPPFTVVTPEGEIINILRADYSIKRDHPA